MAVGDPTGEDLCFGTTDGDTLPISTDSYEEREIAFVSGIEITSGVTYAIVTKAPDASDTNSLVWSTTRPGAYGGGQNRKSVDSGETWVSPTGGIFDEDGWFTTKATGVAKDSYNGATTLGYAHGKLVWWAQTFTATSDYTITSVVLKLAKINGTTPGTVTVSIKAVLPDLPTKATNPTPTNAATDVTLDQATITWEDGGGADSYDVYYGTTSGDLTKVSSEQAGLSFTISGVANGSPFDYVITRYWRIDSINDSGTTTGDEWSFTTIRLDPPSETYWYSTGGYYYRLLPQFNSETGVFEGYGDPPPTGVENTDYEVLAGYLPNFINTNRRLVAAAKNRIYYEDI